MDVSTFCGYFAGEVTDAVSTFAAYFSAWRGPKQQHISPVLNGS